MHSVSWDWDQQARGRQDWAQMADFEEEGLGVREKEKEKEGEEKEQEQAASRPGEIRALRNN